MSELPVDGCMAESGSNRYVHIARKMLEIGVARSHIRRIIATYEPERIERQIRWLQARRAKNRASLLVAAIDNDYEQPISLEDADE